MKQGSRKGRPNYSMDFKRRLAAAACAPDVSVSKLAMAHELNANMVFKWRRQYRAGLLGTAVAAEFLPVAVLPTPKSESSPPLSETPVHGTYCTIEIEIADAIVRVHGAVDAKVLRAVVESLRG